MHPEPLAYAIDVFGDEATRWPRGIDRWETPLLQTRDQEYRGDEPGWTRHGARADAHQRARILRDAGSRMARRPNQPQPALQASAAICDAHDRQEAIGNGEQPERGPSLLLRASHYREALHRY